MDISVYFNDNIAVSSIDIHDANSEEVVQVINEICNYDTIDARYGNENFKLYHKNLEIMDERDEWKQKYENECQYNDSIKKSYDELTKSFKDLLKERDEYKKIASDRDDLKIALNQANDYVAAVEKTRDELLKVNKQLINRINELYGNISYYANSEAKECQKKSESNCRYGLNREE